LVNITENYKENIKTAKALGFDFGQICIWNMDFYTNENLKELKETLEKEEFRATDLWCGWRGPVVWSHPQKYSTLGLVPDYLRAVRMEDLRRGAKFAYDLGVSTVVTHTGFIPDDPYHPTHIAIVNELKAFCKELKDRGQRFAFETGEELPTTLVQFIKSIGEDNIGINLDPANMLINGRGNSYDSLCMFAPYVRGFHAKDGVYPKNGDPKGKEVMVGLGEANFPKLIDKLVEIGYDGYLSIEREIAEGDTRNAEIVKTKKYLEKLIKKSERKQKIKKLFSSLRKKA
jgi:sugar phosphate isomerase/epimerase